ncbi:hypothetical protein AVEN_221807-1 [Araneus ventricosus]|uniref:Uncharacterized protein n=1 Tax=Araneus ventricosus TaxID=182803 RepID=A0A4Y2V694_ARAVE|nr:hypothetical protein AVEN_221807-1 [Araneus ventricosus]
MRTIHPCPSSRFPEGTSSLPRSVVFAFEREDRSPLPTIIFQIFGLVRRMKILTFPPHDADSQLIWYGRRILEQHALNGVEQSAGECPDLMDIIVTEKSCLYDYLGCVHI